MNKSLDTLQVGRGIAALLVTVYHIARHYEKNFGLLPFGNISEIGHTGVDFFFVLSGFIIFYIHHTDVNKPNKFRPFIVKRLSRVYPLYIVMLLLHLLLIPFVASLSFPGFPQLLKQLFLFLIGYDRLLIGVSWTLQFEILFYCAFAILILSHRVGCVIFFIWISIVVTKPEFMEFIPSSVVWMSEYCLQFFMGCITAFIFLKYKPSHSIFLFFTGLIGLIVLWWAELNFIPSNTLGLKSLYGLIFSLLILGMISYESSRSFRPHSFMLLLGEASYAIYLCHLFINGLIYKMLDVIGVITISPHFLSASIIIIFVTIISIFIHLFLEKPLNALVRNKLFKANEIFQGKKA